MEDKPDIICFFCDKWNDWDAETCCNCGSKLKTTCPLCGKTIPIAYMHCDGCGGDLVKYAIEHPTNPKSISKVD